MLGLRPFAVSVALIVGCGDDPPGPPKRFVCAGGALGEMPASGAEIVASNTDLGAYLAVQPATTVPDQPTIARAADIVPPGYVRLGAAVKFGPERSWSDRPFQLTVPYDATKLPRGAEPRHVRVVARREGQEPYFPAVSNRILDDERPEYARASFCAGELTTYQLVAAADAGVAETQRFSWRALIGISMGGFAANTIALRHPEMFDSIVDVGGDPGPSTVYVLNMVRDYLFGGFCTAQDEAAGRGNVGQLCPVTSRRAEQFEITGDYEHQLTQNGDGVGLTLNRRLYTKAARDLARALSNPAHYNVADPYAPPGVPAAYLAQTAAQRCGATLVLSDFYDREFNPAGDRKVITFCDGVDAPGMNGVFDPNATQDDPHEVLLAVDLNGNFKRDYGEPVVTNSYEPFQDVGTDGLANTAEPGYDPVTNPDPSNDDHHYLRNPLGKEGNGDFDPGEPYEDVGIDGVANTCQQGQTPGAGVGGCYDWGQGNGKFDVTPNVDRWYSTETSRLFAALSDEQRRHMSFWYDAGIRDFLNNSVSVNSTVGTLMARHDAPFGVFDGFPVMTGEVSESAYDFTEIDWTHMPRDLYVRYGSPDASAAEIERGDGRHVGTPVQIINRVTTSFAWLDKRWPEGDRSETQRGGRIVKDLVHTSPTTGRMSPYGVFLPPGYDAPENANVRYPTVYFLHGYGQEPQDLVDLSSVFALYMISDRELAVRFQKFIIVYVDGRCRPQRDGVPVDPAGDRCEGGTFYMDAPLGGPARMERNLLDLITHIDATYRTKTASDASIVP